MTSFSKFVHVLADTTILSLFVMFSNILNFILFYKISYLSFGCYQCILFTIKNKIGIVLVTPSFIKRIKAEGIADKELSALLARDLLVPIVHETIFDELCEVSPLLGSRSGLSTIEDSIDTIASKLAERVFVHNN